MRQLLRPYKLFLRAMLKASSSMSDSVYDPYGNRYIFDRAYLGFDFLSTLREAGAHFVVRFKEGVGYRILERFAVPQAPATASFRLTSDWTIRLPGWEGVLLRLVSYRLPDGKLIRVLTDRFDLSALSVAQLYKERWTIESVPQAHRRKVHEALTNCA